MTNTNSHTPCTAPVNNLPKLRRKDFSSALDFEAAHEAQERSNLYAREVFRPAKYSLCGSDIFPKEANMRCQLGEKLREVKIHHPAINGVCDAFEIEVDYFKLIAWGPTWAEVTAAAIAIQEARA